MVGNRELSAMVQLGAVQASSSSQGSSWSAVRERGEWRRTEVFPALFLLLGKEGQEEECQKPTIPDLGPLTHTTHNMIRDLLEKLFCDCNMTKAFCQVGNSSRVLRWPPCREKTSRGRNRDQQEEPATCKRSQQRNGDTSQVFCCGWLAQFSNFFEGEPLAMNGLLPKPGSNLLSTK